MQMTYIAYAGEYFALQMYWAKVTCSVDKLRYLTYNEAIGNSNLSTSFKLEWLPPTSAALRQHSNKIYHAVRQALGRSLPALDWGWMKNMTYLCNYLRTSLLRLKDYSSLCLVDANRDVKKCVVVKNEASIVLQCVVGAVGKLV